MNDLLRYVFLFSLIMVGVSNILMKYYSVHDCFSGCVYSKNADFFILYFGIPSLPVALISGLYLIAIKNEERIEIEKN